MKQGLAVLVCFYLGTQKLLLTITFKAGRSVTDIRDGIELPLAHIHPSQPMSKGYSILLVQPLLNESIRSHPTAQKTCAKGHSSLILYPFYVEKSRVRMAFHTPLQLQQQSWTAFSGSKRSTPSSQRSLNITALREKLLSLLQTVQGHLLLSCQDLWVTGLTWLLRGAALGSRARSGAQECQGGSQPAWVFILKGNCGLAADRRAWQELLLPGRSTLSILALEGVI